MNGRAVFRSVLQVIKAETAGLCTRRCQVVAKEQTVWLA